MSDCICDGAKYEEQRHPFLVHPDCPVHRLTADRDDLAAILDAHDHWNIDNDADMTPRCKCGHPVMVDGRIAHRAHVAQMVLESDWLRGVRAKELRDAAAVEGDPIARVARVWLLNRADRVDAEDTDNTTDRT